MKLHLPISVLILSFLASPVFSQPRAANTPILSSDAQISIIVFGPWQGELYSAFGHSAIRVYDPQFNIDAFYNYGVFSFNQPNFYLNFARGHLNYKLDVDPYAPWRDYYISNNRFVHEQILNFNDEQTQKVFDYLYWNSIPENQYYMYDYFYNNCATKLRDVIKITLKDEVTFDSTYITTNYTIRELTDIYLKYQPWGDLGIDICLGLPMDKKASPYEYMFLPDYIETSFDHATVRTDSVVAPLVLSKVSVYESRPEDPPHSLFHPWLVFGAFLLITIAITWRDIKSHKRSRWFDVVVFGIVGLLGLLLFVLWVATDHRAAARNLNILWAMPLHLVFIPLYMKSKRSAITYFKVIAILNVLLLVNWAWLPQQLNVFLIPVVIALAVRAWRIGWRSHGISSRHGL
ncbi:MAG TPA: DUF4105 domain-containing protein [Cyclobacteriaceae bacterium]|nr:DUF4105 domain-containing protein [Cyclobacteriaceae bacterium]